MNEGSSGGEVVPKVLHRGDGSSIAYHRIHGKSPGIIFLTGYMSDMTGQKALRLEHFCRARDLAYLRFDYFGHGACQGRSPMAPSDNGSTTRCSSWTR